MTQIPWSQWWLIALLIVASPIIIVFVVIGLGIHLTIRLGLNVAVWCWWIPRGRDTLMVYSDSPVWQFHMENEILPAVESRAVVLNWSERTGWPFGLGSAVFRHFAGAREFNPLAVVFRPFRPARVFRFWQPFRDWKHGKREPLARLEEELFAYLGIGNVN